MQNHCRKVCGFEHDRESKKSFWKHRPAKYVKKLSEIAWDPIFVEFAKKYFSRTFKGGGGGQVLKKN